LRAVAKSHGDFGRTVATFVKPGVPRPFFQDAFHFNAAHFDERGHTRSGAKHHQAQKEFLRETRDRTRSILCNMSGLSRRKPLGFPHSMKRTQ
jgi:hypothetical protein